MNTVYLGFFARVSGGGGYRVVKSREEEKQKRVPQQWDCSHNSPLTDQRLPTMASCDKVMPAVSASVTE